MEHREFISMIDQLIKLDKGNTLIDIRDGFIKMTSYENLLASDRQVVDKINEYLENK